ncbi:hypothetical protein C4588_05610 [Candidatus Parcubacteria bacterium]|nr:MAG: hypothetical protein C4588_05610 [Candidatus Parcubacteria bacterium]
MKCPACGSDDAYIGFSEIECENKTCKHFKGGATVLSNPGRVVAKTPPSPFGFPFGLPPAPVMAGPSLTVRITRVLPKQNNVQVSFIADGDPGNPDKEVEIYFDVGNGDTLCTLSHANVHMIPGVDADGSSVYTTNWLCMQDGVKPTDRFQLKAMIY